MIRKLVQKQLVPPEKSFKTELDKLILSMNLPEYPNRKGNKQFTTAQRLYVVLLFYDSQKSLREFCDRFKHTKWPSYLGLKYEIKKSTLNDWIKSFDSKFIKELLDKTNSGEGVEILGIDGTGLQTQYKSKYYEKRLKDFGKRTKSNYHKLDIIANMKGKKKILDYCFHMKQQADIKAGKRLLKRFKEKEKYKLVADKGYYCFDYFDLAKSKNIVLVVPPKNYGDNCRHNSFARQNIQNAYFENKKDYGLRSNCEGNYSALKRTELRIVRARKFVFKKIEVGFKIVLHNIRKEINFVFIFFSKFERISFKL